MVTAYYGFDEDLKIYGQFDTDLGTLTFPIYFEPIGGFLTYLDEEKTQIGLIKYYTFAYYSCAQKQKNDLILSMPELGKFTTGNDMPGYYYEIYLWPESGDPADIDPDKDYVGGDYNIFRPVFTKVEASEGGEGGEGGEVGGTSVKNFISSYKYYQAPRHKSIFDKPLAK